MLLIHKIINYYQHSCTYILYEEECEYAWLVDCGGAKAVEEWLKTNGKLLRGVFLTHCHDDHIFGLRKILGDFPDISIYLSAHEGIRCAQDVRLNLSKYTSNPFQIFSNYFVELVDGQRVKLFPNTMLEAIQTDGHSLDSMTYKVDGFLFTGDAYIPSLAVVTKLPGADKARAAESMTHIISMINSENLTVLPGHEINF